MPTPNMIEVCRAHLSTKEVELCEQYPQKIVDKVLRVREMYNWFIANPDGIYREFVSEKCQRHGIHRTTAYSELAVVKSLLPILGSASRDFHRWRTNEMLIATYKMGDKKVYFKAPNALRNLSARTPPLSSQSDASARPTASPLPYYTV